MRNLILLFLCLYILGGCKKASVDSQQTLEQEVTKSEDKTPPGAFDIIIKNITLSQANISWTASKTPSTNLIKYTITLGNQILKTDLTDLSFQLNGLSENTEYKGTVVAKDKYGNQLAKEFSFTTVDSFVKFFKAYNIADWTSGNISHTVIRTKDNGFVLSGMAYIKNVWNMVLIKTDSNGIEEWQKAYVFKGFPTNARKVKVVQTADNGYALGAGEYMCKVDERGTMLWEHEFRLELNSVRIQCIILSKDGGLILVGSTNPPIGSPNLSSALFVKLSQSGQKVWQTRYENRLRNDPSSIVEMPNGEFYSYGTAGGQDNVGACLYKLSAQGQVLSYKSWNESGYDFAEDIKLTNSNTLLCAGRNGNKAWVQELDLNGNIINSNLELGRQGVYYSVITSLTTTSDNGYAVTGYSLGDGGSVVRATLFFAKVDSSGKVEWQKFNDTDFLDSYGFSIIQTLDLGYAVAGYGARGVGSSPSTLLFKLNKLGNYR